MKPIWISLTVFLLALPNPSFSSPIEHFTSSSVSDNNSFSLSDFEVRQRLDELKGKVDLKYNAAVEKNIRHYLNRRKKSISDVIGRSQLYFPIFEHYLQVNNMPDELKYLSIVESALNPKAKSPVGASGLWQFMKGTGYLYGLKVDSYIDERNDPIKASEAAFRYLRDLHKRYDDWTLAIAAYNCGPGRVNRAIRQARTMDFWKLRKYLPSETRNYVPAFIAVTYVMNYYESHGIEIQPAKEKFSNFSTITLFDSKSFYDISKVSDVDFNLIEKLNPAYKRKYIPKATYGNYLTLPIIGMEKLKDKMRQDLLRKYYKSNSASYNEFMNIPENMIQSTYIVQKGESIEYIAKLLKCTKEELADWNKLESLSIFNGQELTVYFPKTQLSKNIMTLADEEEELETSEATDSALPETTEEKITVYHTMEEGQTLGEISELYADVTLSEIIRKNKLFGEITLKPGDKIKIK